MTVTAEWNNQTFPAAVNAYGVATIAASTPPNDADDHELHRFDDDGGQPMSTSSERL